MDRILASIPLRGMKVVAAMPGPNATLFTDAIVDSRDLLSVQLPPFLRNRQPLLLTTNYDALVEQRSTPFGASE